MFNQCAFLGSLHSVNYSLMIEFRACKHLFILGWMFVAVHGCHKTSFQLRTTLNFADVQHNLSSGLNCTLNVGYELHSSNNEFVF
jgi:hypothetical protein